jgi:hypothetical protein
MTEVQDLEFSEMEDLGTVRRIRLHDCKLQRTGSGKALSLL